MNWEDLIPGIVSYPVKIYKNRNKIQELWKKALALSDLGATNILILGRENVGKTLFLDYLNGKANDTWYEKPESSKQADREAIKIGEWHSLFRTAPGQFISSRDKTIDDAFDSDSDLEGIIYLTDWGFTNIRDETAAKILIDNGIDTIEKLREHNLKEERKDFEKIVDQVRKLFRSEKSINWLLVVATKADLFYSEELFSKAQREYHPSFDGQFSNLLNLLQANIGNDRFKIDAIPFCSHREDFIWNGEKVKSHIGESENQNKLLRNFYSKILELR